MVKKVRCSVTGNVIYMTEKRYTRALAKYGSEESLKANYVSLVGKRFKEGQIDDVPLAKNRIKCTITGRVCYITNQRIQAVTKKHGTWEDAVKNYVCRPAARLLREGKTADQIKEMVANGTFPEK